MKEEEEEEDIWCSPHRSFTDSPKDKCSSHGDPKWTCWITARVGASRSVSGRQGGRRSRGGKRGVEQLELTSTGSLKSRDPTLKSSLNLQRLSTLSQTLRCRISARDAPPSENKSSLQSLHDRR